jgi:hypothetical protein
MSLPHQGLSNGKSEDTASPQCPCHTQHQPLLVNHCDCHEACGHMYEGLDILSTCTQSTQPDNGQTLSRGWAGSEEPSPATGARYTGSSGPGSMLHACPVLHQPWVLLGTQGMHSQPFDETLRPLNTLVDTDSLATCVHTCCRDEHTSQSRHCSPVRALRHSFIAALPAGHQLRGGCVAQVNCSRSKSLAGLKAPCLHVVESALSQRCCRRTAGSVTTA